MGATPGDQRPHCPACGLHEPCKTCGKVRLGLVPAAPTGFIRDPLEPEDDNYTRLDLIEAVRLAWTAGWVAHRDRTMTSPSGEDLLNRYLAELPL